MTNNKSRTPAFQIDENLFQRIKAHLERESARTGRKLTQREFVLGLVEAALDEAERQAAEDSPEPEMEEQPSEDAGVSPCAAHSEGSRYHTTREMDSFRIKDRRTWKRYSSGKGGDAISSSQSPLCSVSA